MGTATRIPVLAFVSLILGIAPTRAQGLKGTDVTVRVGATYETLSRDFAPWRSVSVDVNGTTPSGHSLYGAAVEMRRFSALDRDFLVGVRRRVSSQLAVTVEGEVSPTHHNLPKWVAGTQLDVTVGRGWNLQAGVHERRYDSTSLTLASLTAERYWARYRGAYTLYVSALRDGGISASHRLHGDYYYDRLGSSVGVSLAAGRELEHLGHRGLLRTSTQAVAVRGRQWIVPRWFVGYEGVIHRQGSLYTRNRVSLSLGHSF